MFIDFVYFHVVFSDRRIYNGGLIITDLLNIFIKWFFVGFI